MFKAQNVFQQCYDKLRWFCVSTHSLNKCESRWSSQEAKEIKSNGG